MSKWSENATSIYRSSLSENPKTLTLELRWWRALRLFGVSRLFIKLSSIWHSIEDRQVRARTHEIYTLSLKICNALLGHVHVCVDTSQRVSPIARPFHLLLVLFVCYLWHAHDSRTRNPTTAPWPLLESWITRQRSTRISRFGSLRYKFNFFNDSIFHLRGYAQLRRSK